MILNQQWDIVVGQEFNKPYLKALIQAIDKARSIKTIYPNKHQIFEVFRYCDYTDVKVVIVNLEPNARGLNGGIPFNFVSPEEEKYLGTTRVIMNTVNTEIYNDSSKTIYNDFINWVLQGVFLLNLCLTVEENKPLSHKGKGWETFTNIVFRSICEKSTPVVFLLWGKYCHHLASYVYKHNHKVICSEHPYDALREFRQWNNNQCFRKTNEFLASQHYTPLIEWNEELPF